MKKYQSYKSKVVTTRLSATEYLAIVDEAENKGTNVSDVLRSAWSKYQSGESLKAELSKLEHNLCKKIFEICSAVTGLTDEERETVINELDARMQGVHNE